MSQFQFKTPEVCQLDFCGKVQTQLPLTVAEGRRLEEVGAELERQKEAALELPKEAQYDALYDDVMIAIDSMLQEDGIAERIADCAPDPAHFDILQGVQVIEYIIDEFKQALAAAYGEQQVPERSVSPERPKRRVRRS